MTLDDMHANSRFTKVSLGTALSDNVKLFQTGRDEFERRAIRESVDRYLSDAASPPNNYGDARITGPYTLTLDVKDNSFIFNLMNASGEQAEAAIPVKELTPYIHRYWNAVAPYAKDTKVSGRSVVTNEIDRIQDHLRAGAFVRDKLAEQGISSPRGTGERLFAILYHTHHDPLTRNPCPDVSVKVAMRDAGMGR